MSTLHNAPDQALRVFDARGARIQYECGGEPVSSAKFVMVWAHGWGQTRAAMRALSQSVRGAAHVLIDFPGFGGTAPPQDVWGTGDYADACAAMLREIAPGKTIVWAGHSFGGRVGIQLAARHQGLLAGLVLIAAAGLKRKRPPLQALQLWARVRVFKLMKALFPARAEKMRAQMGSADYRNAGAMRPIFVKTVNEDLADAAKQVACPVLLVYGARDTETPAEYGERYQRLMPNAELSIIPNNDHYSVLGEGRHVVAKRLAGFLEKL